MEDQEKQVDIKRLVWEAQVEPKGAHDLGKTAYWVGHVRVNRNITLRYTTNDGALVTKQFQQDQINLCDFVGLCQLVQKELQEGPAQRWQDYDAPFDLRSCNDYGDGEDARPFVVTVVEQERVRKERPLENNSDSVPDLNEKKKPGRKKSKQ